MWLRALFLKECRKKINNPQELWQHEWHTDTATISTATTATTTNAHHFFILERNKKKCSQVKEHMFVWIFFLVWKFENAQSHDGWICYGMRQKEGVKHYKNYSTRIHTFIEFFFIFLMISGFALPRLTSYHIIIMQSKYKYMMSIYLLFFYHIQRHAI